MKNYLKAVKLLFSADKILLIKCIFFVILFLAMESLVPVYMQWMMNQTEQNRDGKQLILYVLVFAVAYLLLCLFDAIRAESIEHLGKHVLWKTREKIYNVMWRGDYAGFLQDNREKYKFLLSQETYLVYTVTTVYTINLLINFLIVAIFMVIAFLINLYVGLVLLVAFVATWGLSFLTGKRILHNYEKYDDAREADAINNNENVDMVEVIRTNGLMSYYDKKNKKTVDEYIAITAKGDREEVFLQGMERAIHYIIYVLIAGVLMISPDYSGGQLVTTLFITNYLLEQSQAFQHQLQVIMKNIPVFNKVMDIEEVPAETGDEVEKIYDITFDKVSLSYSEDREIFRDVSFALQKGDNVLVAGENGSGKSSVLKMIAGLVLPTNGMIQINGKNMNTYNRQHLYKEICYISQDELLLNESVEAYLRIITHSDADDSAIAALRKKVRFTSEIDTITDNGKLLSGGEKKKLLMIKSLLRPDASVIILDEIDAGLDVETKSVMKEIEEELLADKEQIFIKISHIDTDTTGFNKVIQM